MENKVIEVLREINRTFYLQYGESFARTRRRVQNGVKQVLERLPDEGVWLDIGCGSGALAVEWLQRGRKSRYIGMDFSEVLLEEARRAVSVLHAGEQVTFLHGDLTDPDWHLAVQDIPLQGILAFAVLHHIPSHDLRLALLRTVHSLLSPGGWFVHSEWQFQHSPKLMSRRLPWSAAGLSEEDLEAGDTLLDWRETLSAGEGQRGLRYVHLFSPEELQQLAEQAGFSIEETFSSDGLGNRLSLYQIWKRL
ncbi:class I SAM-dependent methyltransferase [Anaerolinea sp.]|uniref:class I SAM-dependent methyltransferase n=1 Tax=Anaerolinea sp. TaxID=1872519 RepID=UPI002ACEFE17|nr:class I SAM-dependent methyltransferase [Anaerolinea sp.]